MNEAYNPGELASYMPAEAMADGSFAASSAWKYRYNTVVRQFDANEPLLAKKPKCITWYHDTG
jgi:hypothetical protein